MAYSCGTILTEYSRGTRLASKSPARPSTSAPSSLRTNSLPRVSLLLPQRLDQLAPRALPSAAISPACLLPLPHGSHIRTQSRSVVTSHRSLTEDLDHDGRAESLAEGAELS